MTISHLDHFSSGLGSLVTDKLESANLPIPTYSLSKMCMHVSVWRYRNARYFRQSRRSHGPIWGVQQSLIIPIESFAMGWTGIYNSTNGAISGDLVT